ncbi:SAM-dependent methyltransferase [Acinetobacter shaoyimingii]|uniref:Class I SAM-dependent methyltransferase n=1 Tax=Acinetobacter shaoyimingii TaxID=2715164 RepID=A0A6G8RRZ7_9GAMM|nr:class I SAM-dependent methyltransferase [Acinetobacter shaoyimingii]QIO04681.1 class I SAM-dependent methyltransferase [Acinetobacter shaoyimingii]
MKWLQAFKFVTPKHKYAIDAKALGDDAECAWSNLGYWNHADDSYPEACRQLADHLADIIHLTSNDKLLDLGCGQGASVLHWKNYYKIQNITAVELQVACVAKIQQKQIDHFNIYCGSFLNLKQIQLNSQFDVILCIDAAYHSPLHLFLESVSFVLKPEGRLAFHTLMLSEKFSQLNVLQQAKYRFLLKCADVQLADLMSKPKLAQCLSHHAYDHIQIEDLSEPVLNGFSKYIQARKQHTAFKGLDGVKIEMTAKLCKTLYEEGIVRYVQVSAKKQL